MFFTAIKPLFEKFIQESESIETPSSLSTCFLEMGNHLNLASFLKRKKLFVPNILSIKSIKSVSKDMALTILRLVEYLLNMEIGNHEHQDKILLHGIFLTRWNTLHKQVEFASSSLGE